MENDYQLKVNLKLKKIGLPDHSIFLNPKDEGLSNQLSRSGIREPINSYFLAKTIKSKKPNVLDIGGNIGYFPIIEALSDAKTVSVYEPVSETFEFLTKNTSHFTNIKCYNMGIGEKSEEKKIYITNRRNNASIEPCKEYFEGTNIEIQKTETVKLITLSEACKKISDKNILCRMDVEGYESKILTNIPKEVTGISFEFHTKILGKKQSIELIEKLENEGFQITLMTRELEGLKSLFKIFGFGIFKVYNLLKEKRIYFSPKKSELIEIIEKMRENPHIFAFR